jgi:hypothetical protein
LRAFTPEDGAKGSEKSKDLKKKAEIEEKKEAQEDQAAKAEAKPSSAAPLSEETQAGATLPGDPENNVITSKEEEEGTDGQTPIQRATANTANPLAPLETVLQMPPPTSEAEENELKPPHLQAPPYIHHFDTYTLVQQVEAGGFTNDQSITAMKAVRGLLAVNLDLAKAGLVSKSDVENVSLVSQLSTCNADLDEGIIPVSRSLL